MVGSLNTVFSLAERWWWAASLLPSHWWRDDGQSRYCLLIGGEIITVTILYSHWWRADWQPQYCQLSLYLKMLFNFIIICDLKHSSFSLLSLVSSLTIKFKVHIQVTYHTGHWHSRAEEGSPSSLYTTKISHDKSSYLRLRISISASAAQCFLPKMRSASGAPWS